MTNVKVRAYLAPSVVLLAFDWTGGRDRKDFLGFAIQREPGFNSGKASWLPNRIGFNGPDPKGKDLPTNNNPIQKFMWWDARIDRDDTDKTFVYTVFPVVGTDIEHHLIENDATTVRVKIPKNEVKQIGTYFNRAVVSSQAFSRKFRNITKANINEALKWLANGLEDVIPSFISNSESVEGAVYHLNDEKWIIPAFASFAGNISLVLDSDPNDPGNKVAICTLGKKPTIQLIPRKRANIMHNKFLVRFLNGEPSSLLMGSANFTTGALSTQANLLHTFRSPELAELYLHRKRILQHDPKVSKIAEEGAWSRPIRVGDATIRVFFSPEPKKFRFSIDQIIDSIQKSKKSIVFCLYSTTDKPLRDAIFTEADKGKMMFGLVNIISETEKKLDTRPSADAVTRVEIYHRSRQKEDVYAHSLYPKSDYPEGFWWERSSLPKTGKKKKNEPPPVYIHHKFIVIDAETQNPIIYTGSANMSQNSSHRNDENLLEIKGSHELAAIYLCEFLRLYEHYRARKKRSRWEKGKQKDYRLTSDASWTKDYYKRGTPRYKSRINLSTKF
jgi:phosphatidylserine/phosphatidylglycerophosphate/cardiolipin synthase-like enzyme